MNIQYGLDLEFGNNTTQRNLQVEASSFDVRVENPYMVPAKFYVRAESNRADWPCSLDQSEFMIGGPEDCPVHVHVGLRGPIEARIGAYADCNISVFARASGAQESTLIGGVTVRSIVPDTCVVTLKLIGPNGEPLRHATLVFERDVPSGLLRAPWEYDRTVTLNNSKGKLSVMLPAGAHKRLRILTEEFPEQTIPFESRCNAGQLTIQVGKDSGQLSR